MPTVNLTQGSERLSKHTDFVAVTGWSLWSTWSAAAQTAEPRVGIAIGFPRPIPSYVLRPVPWGATRVRGSWIAALALMVLALPMRATLAL